MFQSQNIAIFKFMVDTKHKSAALILTEKPAWE